MNNLKVIRQNAQVKAEKHRQPLLHSFDYPRRWHHNGATILSIAYEGPGFSLSMHVVSMNISLQGSL